MGWQVVSSNIDSKGDSIRVSNCRQPCRSNIEEQECCHRTHRRHMRPDFQMSQPPSQQHDIYMCNGNIVLKNVEDYWQLSILDILWEGKKNNYVCECHHFFVASNNQKWKPKTIFVFRIFMDTEQMFYVGRNIGGVKWCPSSPENANAQVLGWNRQQHQQTCQ